MSVSDLLLRVECYVAMRSAIGYTVRYEEKLLKDFVVHGLAGCQQPDSRADGGRLGLCVGPRPGATTQAKRFRRYLILTWKDDESRQVRAHFRGFDIVSQGKRPSFLESDPVPSLFLRASGTYSAGLNPANPVGTIQSIEHTLRSLERTAEREREQLQQLEGNLAAFRNELAKPFEHEARLKEMLVKQTESNAALDLNKNDVQAAADLTEEHLAG